MYCMFTVVHLHKISFAYESTIHISFDIHDLKYSTKKYLCFFYYYSKPQALQKLKEEKCGKIKGKKKNERTKM